MTLNKTTRKEKFYQKMRMLYFRQNNARKFSLFKQCNFFNGEGFFKIMSLRFTLMKALKSSIRLHWWPFPKMHDALSTHVFTKSRKEWNGSILLFVEESHFFKWFNYADSRAIIIRYISLQQQQKNEIFSLKSENFAEFIVQQNFLNCGSKRQYAITKLFKSVSGFVLS